GAVVALADPAADAAVRPLRHAVAHRVVGVDRPPEEVAVEPLELLAVLAQDLEPRDRVGHLALLPDRIRGYDERDRRCRARPAGGGRGGGGGPPAPGAPPASPPAAGRGRA